MSTRSITFDEYYNQKISPFVSNNQITTLSLSCALVGTSQKILGIVGEKSSDKIGMLAIKNELARNIIDPRIAAACLAMQADTANDMKTALIPYLLPASIADGTSTNRYISQNIDTALRNAMPNITEIDRKVWECVASGWNVQQARDHMKIGSRKEPTLNNLEKIFSNIPTQSETRNAFMAAIAGFLRFVTMEDTIHSLEIACGKTQKDKDGKGTYETEGRNKIWVPLPRTIRNECEKIKEMWSDRERRKRAGKEERKWMVPIVDVREIDYGDHEEPNE